MDATSVVGNATTVVTNPQQTSSVIVSILRGIGTASQWISGLIYSGFNTLGIPLSQIGAGIILLAIFIGFILLIAKIAKPVLKIAFLVLVGIFIFGLFINLI